MRKIYLFLAAALVAVSSFAQEEIAFIYGTQDYALNDSAIIDTVNSLGDFNVTAVLCADDLDLSGYDGMIIGESMGSSAIDKAVKEYTIPCVHLKAWGLRKSNITWAKDVDGNELFNAIENMGDAADAKEATEVEIDDEDNPIFTGVSSPFSIADDTLGGYAIGDLNLQAFDLEGSGIEDIADNATNVATSVFADGQGLEFTTIIATIDANGTCENTVCIGLHGNLKLTKEAMTVITNSLYWVMDMEIPVEGPVDAVESIRTSNYRLYPNPVQDVLNIKNASTIANIEIMDITGKVVVSNVNNGANSLQINTSEFNSGIYMVRLKDVDGNIFTDKLMK